MKLLFFWIFFGIDALICTIVAVFFFIGLGDGSVSWFNSGIWTTIWVVLTVIIAGSLGLKAVGHPVLGMILLLVLAVPGILSGFLLFLFVVTNSRWN